MFALFVPVEQRGDIPNLPFGKIFWSASIDPPMQNFFLNVRRQIQQVHNLRDPCPTDVTEPGEVGIIPGLTAVNHFLEFDRQGH